MMVDVKYLILGAGPAGLSVANKLIQNGEKDLILIEKEDTVGGLCRSRIVDGTPLDIGGGHFLDVQRENVLNFLFKFLPDKNWNKYIRNSQIYIHNQYIGSPIEANIWQFPIEMQVDYLKSIAKAGCVREINMPTRFVDWIFWKLGDRIANDYMIPYNEKMFGDNLNELGTYWLNKLPDVSFEDTLMSCLQRKPYGKQPAHSSFLYPKNDGYGIVWEIMGKNLGDKLILNTQIKNIDVNNRIVNGKYKAEYIINTIPWDTFSIENCHSSEIYELVSKLKHSSVVIEYHCENMNTEAQWIYYPDLKYNYHRKLIRNNFCTNSRGYWTETNLERFKPSTDFYYINDYSYPLNTIDKKNVISSILNIMKEKQIYGLGRWGEWQHYNSDVVVELAIRLADKLCEENM